MSNNCSMKKIIFVINNLQTGGVQTSLLNLLKEMHNEYDVTVLCLYSMEEYHKLLPDNVKLVSLRTPYRYLGVSQRELSNPISKFFRAFWACLTKVFGRSFAIKLMSPFQRNIGTYDCAVSFLHEGPQKNFYGGCNEFVLKKVKANKKITWLHCDFGLCGANNKASEKIYQQFDEIVACSEGAKQAFLQCLPQFEHKCISIRNCNDYDCIRKLAGEGMSYDKTTFNIVSVARLSAEKGIERAITAVKKCVDNGYNVHYHIVGWGDRAEYLKGLVEEYKLSENVTFYGNQSNPYPYIKNADLFLLPSYHEAAPMVFDEAACLGVPVLATKTTSTEEMITQCHAGFVCENSQDGINDGLMEILKFPDMLADIKNALKSRLFTNKENIEKFCGVINDTGNK